VQENIIENILGSLDGLERANPSGFFYEKIRTKLNTPERSLLDKMDFFFTRRSIALSLTSLILALNLIVLEADIIHTSRQSENADNSISINNDLESLVFGGVSDNEYAYTY